MHIYIPLYPPHANLCGLQTSINKRWKETDAKDVVEVLNADDAVIINERHVQRDQHCTSSTGSFPRCL